MHHLSRRQFLEDTLLATAAAAAAAAPKALVAQQKTPSVGPNERITAAILGCGIRGKQHANELTRLTDCDIAYVCDPDRDRTAEVAKLIEDKQRPAPKPVQDLRTVLDDASVDVVFIATPNHWHALAAIWAMQAGKDAYVEKPVSHNVAEGRRIVQTARKHNRICQGGTQNRSSGAWKEATQYIRDGKLGDVRLARCIHYGRRGSIGGPTKCEIPASVDYNLWLGPAADIPLTRSKFHYDWHWVWNTGNGELGNNNIHYMDLCRWGLNVTGLGRSVLSYGGRFGYTDAGETPNTQVCVFNFDDKAIISETRGLKSAPFHPNFAAGCVFYGTEGIIAEGSLFDLEGNLVRKFEGRSDNHFANFLQAVRTRNSSDLNAEILEGHQSTALCHIGNISYRLGRPTSPSDVREQFQQGDAHDQALETLERTLQHLEENGIGLANTHLTLGAALRLDPEGEAFLDQPKANALLARDYRAPFVVPSESDI